MADCRCRVSFKDSDEIEHAAEVTAETLYLAVAAAVKRFRDCGLTVTNLNAFTNMQVEVLNELKTTHSVELGKVMKYGKLETGAVPAEISRRRRVKDLLGLA